jgi:HEAT repeat protein
MRTMAIESLAGRPTEGALATLGDIARNDPDLPARPLITSPRDPRDTSTELPDETVFSPRMQAMSALASTRDPRAVAVLADVVKSGPDEALRMEAARNLGGLRADPRAGEVLRAAAASDPSAYVRLAALHALHGAADPSLAPLLEDIAARDRDAGVRILAQQLLTDLRR